jgi:hypothetical protein
VLAVGDRLPEASLWTAPRERRQLTELVADRPALFLFYLFDWSST